MATGTISNYAAAYKAGDSFAIPSGLGAWPGTVMSSGGEGGGGKRARINIPLSKPVQNGVTVKAYGDFSVRLSSGRFAIAVAQNNPITGYVTDCGIKFDIDNSASMASNYTPCIVASQGVTIYFE